MTDSPRSADPPPGWYAGSPSTTRLRWWNGSAWTDHYQGAIEPMAAVVAEPAERMPTSTTRAERRAAERLAIPEALSLASGSSAPAVAVGDPVSPKPLAEEAPAPTPPAQAPPELTPSAQAPLEKFPDQIVDRGPRTYDRPPLPVTYRPPAATHGHIPTTRSTFIPLPQSNGPAIASLTVSVLSVLSAATVFVWVRLINPVLADVVGILTLAAVGTAFVLAVVGLVLAWRRPTGKAVPVLALIASSLLVGAIVVLFALNVISIALPLPA